MEIMIILFVISILLVALYAGAAIWKKKELPESISSMVYLLPDKGRWVWTIWIWGSTLTLAPVLFEIMPENWQVLAYGFATSMMFVGAMPLVRQEENKAHNAFAVAAGIFSQLCVLLIYNAWVLLWCVLAINVLFIKDNGDFSKWLRKKGLFIVEHLCWFTLIGAIATRLIKNL